MKKQELREAKSHAQENKANEFKTKHFDCLNAFGARLSP